MSTIPGNIINANNIFLISIQSIIYSLLIRTQSLLCAYIFDIHAFTRHGSTEKKYFYRILQNPSLK